METTALNYILAFIGMLLYILYKIQYRKEKDKDKFDIAYWMKDNVIHVIIAVVATMAGLLMQEDIFHYVCDVVKVDLTWGYEICSFMIGFLNQYALMWLERKVRYSFFPKNTVSIQISDADKADNV